MKKIIKWLEENGIEYSVNKYGNPYYFNDGFSVDGIQISLYYNDTECENKDKLLINYMKRKRKYSLTLYNIFGVGFTYIIMTALDAEQLKQHEKAVHDAAEKFWKEEHERRMAQKTSTNV